jgi:hypothetical protein
MIYAYRTVNDGMVTYSAMEDGIDKIHIHARIEHELENFLECYESVENIRFTGSFCAPLEDLSFDQWVDLLKQPDQRLKGW